MDTNPFEELAARGAWRADGPLTPSILGSLAEINELTLELLAARASRESALPGRPPLLVDLGELWRAQTPLQRRRLAHCPYLLIDAGFADLTRWSARAPEVRDSDASWFGGEEGVRLAGLVMIYAWHVARMHRPAARLLLGMSDDCASLIASMTVRQLGDCLERASYWIRPRWAERAGVWRHLLVAAATQDDARFEQVRLRGLQLMASEVWQADRGWRR